MHLSPCLLGRGRVDPVDVQDPGLDALNGETRSREMNAEVVQELAVVEFDPHGLSLAEEGKGRPAAGPGPLMSRWARCRSTLPFVVRLAPTPPPHRGACAFDSSSCGSQFTDRSTGGSRDRFTRMRARRRGCPADEQGEERGAAARVPHNEPTGREAAALVRRLVTHSGLAASADTPPRRRAAGRATRRSRSEEQNRNGPLERRAVRRECGFGERFRPVAAPVQKCNPLLPRVSETGAERPTPTRGDSQTTRSADHLGAAAGASEGFSSRRLRERFLMRMRGLEPPRPFGHTDLNRARLPIPPHPRGGTIVAQPNSRGRRLPGEPSRRTTCSAIDGAGGEAR